MGILLFFGLFWNISFFLAFVCPKQRASFWSFKPWMDAPAYWCSCLHPPKGNCSSRSQTGKHSSLWGRHSENCWLWILQTKYRSSFHILWLKILFSTWNSSWCHLWHVQGWYLVWEIFCVFLVSYFILRSLGVIGYIMLTNTMPFREDVDNMDIVDAQRHRRYRYSSKLGLSFECKSAIDKMMTFDPKHRPVS